MKNYAHILTVALIGLVSIQGVQAQKAGLKLANKYFDELNYQEAIPIYQSIVKKNNSFDAKVKLAECYRKTDDYGKTEELYADIVTSPDAKPLHKLYYGQALLANGKYKDAEKWFGQFAQTNNESRGEHMLESCREQIHKNLMERESFFKITAVPEINSAADDNCPVLFKDGIVFTSDRKEGKYKMLEHAWTGRNFNELYFTKQNAKGDGMEKPTTFAKPINSKFHDGMATFSADGKVVYFTRNNFLNGKAGKDKDNVMGLKIYKSSVDAQGNWSKPEILPFDSDDYDCAHPALSPDGETLYFASNMPGGFGGMDLYMCKMEGSSWSAPVNLGAKINTEGNEVFPYAFTDKMLYFASDGQIGLGGLDLYTAQMDGRGVYGNVSNLGYPLNTSYDDFGITYNDDKTTGYFTSNRPGGKGGDDIYSFKRIAAKVELLIVDEKTGAPIEGAQLSGDCLKGNETTDSKGGYRTEIAPGNKCSFNSSKPGYKPGTGIVETKPNEPGTYQVRIAMRLIPVFNLNGVVYEEGSKTKIAGAIVTLKTDCGQSETVMSGADGSYAFKLKPECAYTILMAKDGAEIAKGEASITTKGLTDSKTFVEDFMTRKKPEPKPVPSEPVTIEDKLKGGVLEHIYYDFDKYFIREDASTDLQVLYKLMTDNPNIVVEISSHTDSRGSDSYNIWLSNKRAEAVVNWLKTKGINPKRLTYKGYGESRLVNGCKNGVKCTEEDHQRNRRTEFTVVGHIDTYGKDGIKSTAPKKVNVDSCKNCPF